MATGAELDKCYETALELVKEAGKLVTDSYGKARNIETKTFFADLVTETDKQVEDLLIGKLNGHFPDHKFIGEETVSAGQKADYTSAPTWIIDPVDGTTNFVHGFPVVGISVALAVNREIEIAFVYNPVLDRLYTARRNQGAYCNGTRLKASDCTELSNSLFIAEAGSNRDPKIVDLVFANMMNMTKQAHGMRSMGSAALNMCSVAAGEADAYYEFGIHCWDIAAGLLIVREAGGVVMDTEGGPLDLMSRRLICASSQPLADAISKSLKHYRFESD